MKHYLKYLAAPLVMVIWSMGAEAQYTPMKVWFTTGCVGGPGYDWMAIGNNPPSWAGSYQPQGSPICYDNNASALGIFDSFVQCVQDGRESASALDHAACLFMGIVVTGSVAGSILLSGGALAPGWLGAIGLITGAAAGVGYSSVCYCVMNSGF